jgi:hypothetical protein
MVTALDLGDGYGFLGFKIEPRVQDDGTLIAVMVAIGGKIQELSPTKTVEVPIGIVGGISVADFKAHIDGKPPELAEAPKEEAV